MRYSIYEKYKNSEIQWFNQIPVSWYKTKIAYGFNLIGSGTTPSSQKNEYYDGNIPWITTSELREKDIYEANHYITEIALQDYSALKIYDVDTLLIAMYGATVGRLGILKISATVNQACCAFAKPSLFTTKFVFWWFQMMRDTLLTLAYGGGQPNLSQDLLKQLRLYVPAISEQQQIADFLDQKTIEIDRLIEKQEALIALLNEQRQSIITQAVTKGLDPTVPMKDSGVEWLGEIPEHWNFKRLRYLCAINPVKSEVSALDDDFEVSFIPMEAISEKGMIKSDEVRCLGDVYTGYTYFINNDVVIAKITPCFENGKIALAKDLHNGIAFGTTELHVLRANTTLILPEFLYFLAITEPFMKIGEAQMYGAGGQKRVPESFIKNFMAILPPIKEQEKIIEFIKNKIDEIDNLQSKTEKMIDYLKEYRLSLITHAVTGKIKVSG